MFLARSWLMFLLENPKSKMATITFLILKQVLSATSKNNTKTAT
jgi:hypothetical protein